MSHSTLVVLILVIQRSSIARMCFFRFAAKSPGLHRRSSVDAQQRTQSDVYHRRMRCTWCGPSCPVAAVDQVRQFVALPTLVLLLVNDRLL